MVSSLGSDYVRCAESRTIESETQVDAVDEQQEQAKAERGEKTAENVRYGQNISEGGMGGMTTDSQGGGNQGMRCIFMSKMLSSV